MRQSIMSGFEISVHSVLIFDRCRRDCCSVRGIIPWQWRKKELCTREATVSRFCLPLCCCSVALRLNVLRNVPWRRGLGIKFFSSHMKIWVSCVVTWCECERDVNNYEEGCCAVHLYSVHRLPIFNNNRFAGSQQFPSATKNERPWRVTDTFP